MKRKLFYLLSLCLTCFLLRAQTDSWTQKSNFANGGVGSSRESAIGFQIYSKGYIGLGNSGGSVTGTLWEFDVQNNTWTQKANITAGGARQGAVAFVVNNRAYIGTGENASFTKDKKFYEYNPSNNTWTPKTDFPGTARTEAVAFSINNKGYVGTGSDGSRRKDFWEYDAATDTWTQKADFGGTARSRAVGFAIDGKGYIATGNDGSRKRDVWQYDPATNTWVQKNNFGGTARESAVAFVIGNYAYIATGDTGSGSKEIWEYDPALDSWARKTDLPGDRRYVAASFSSDLSGYIGTGFSDAGATGSNRNDVWAYKPYALQAPELLPVVSVTSNSIRLQWEYWTPSSEYRFQIYRSTNGTDFTLIGQTDVFTTNFPDNALTTGQTYYYRVRAVSTAGVSALSNIVSANTTPFNMGHWVRLATGEEDPKNQERVDAFSIQNHIYLPFTVNSSYQLENVLWSFNPTTGIWTQKATGPTPRKSFRTFVLNDKAYLVCGITHPTYHKDVWQYNPATNEWIQKSNFPGAARHSPVCFVIDGKAYVGGGSTSGTPSSVTDFYEYDPENDTWTPKASVPESLSYSFSFSGNGVGYIGAGFYRKLYEYNPVSNQWTVKKPLPFSRWSANSTKNATCTLNGRIFLMLYLGQSNFFLEYLQAEDKFRELSNHPNLVSNFEGSLAAANDKLYFLLGVNGGYSMVYDPDTPFPTVQSLRADIIDDQKIKLGWTKPESAVTQLRLFRSSAEEGPYQEIALINANQDQYIDGIATNTPLYYKAQAVSAEGASRLSEAVQAQPTGAWTRLKNFSGTRDGAYAASTSTKGYMGLVFDYSGAHSKEWWEYDPATDTWTQKADFPGTIRILGVTLSIQEKIYLGLGQDNSSPAVLSKEFWAFDPAKNTWTKKNDFPGEARIEAAAASSGVKGYVAMGRDGNHNYFKDVWQYDATTDSWIELPEYPQPGRRLACAVVYNNELIIMNGWQKNNTGSQSIQEQYRLSLAENVWRKEAKPPVWVIAGNTFIIGDTFYAYTHTIYGNPSLHAYHLPSGKWTYKISAPFNSSTHSFRIDKSAYFISSKEVWRFDPEDYVATPSDLVSEMKNGRFLIHWKNNSTKPVKVILQQTGVSINPVTIAEVQGNLETYNFKNYKQNHHYYIRAIAVSEQGAYSEFTNTTTLHTGPYWTKVGDLPMAPRQYSILQAANNNLYYGLGEAGSVFYNDLWMYDEVTGVWTQKADFPGKPRSRANTFVIQNQLYAGLGSGSTGTYQDMYKYNAATNEWIASVDFPKAGYRRMGVFVHNNAAYFAGGQVSTANSSVELYRFNGTSWTELSSIPGDPRADPLTFVYNGKAYIGGGEKIENGWYSGTREFFEYDISTGTWKKLNDLPSELHINYPMFGYTLSDGAYIFGLRSNGSGIIAYKYKAASDTWEPASLTHLYPGYFVQTQMVRTDNGLAFGVVPFGNGRELWRFDPMINGPEIVELRNPSTGRVTIKWRRIIPQPDSVGIERSETVDGAFLETLVIKTSDTTATDVVPESGKEYFYRVKAYRGHGYVKRSPYKSINVAPAPPGPALIATYTGGAISLSWTAIQNNSIYTVERSVNDEPFEELLSTSSTSTQDIVTGEHKYSYRVYTKNPETRRSNTVTILITGSEDNEYSLPIRVYPNPAVDQLIITLPESRIQTGVIHDQTGKVVCHVQLQREAVLDVSLFKPGLYFITLKGNTADKQRVIKFIKK